MTSHKCVYPSETCITAAFRICLCFCFFQADTILEKSILSVLCRILSERLCDMHNYVISQEKLNKICFEQNFKRKSNFIPLFCHVSLWASSKKSLRIQTKASCKKLLILTESVSPKFITIVFSATTKHCFLLRLDTWGFIYLLTSGALTNAKNAPDATLCPPHRTQSCYSPINQMNPLRMSKKSQKGEHVVE